MMTNQELEKLRKVVRLTFIRIGIRCDMIGFQYLCYAVEKVIEDPNLIHNLCKGLYVEIASHFNVTKVSSVERSIRHAIEFTCDDKTFDALNRMFDTLLYEENQKPTVGELIRLVAEYYLLDLYKEN